MAGSHRPSRARLALFSYGFRPFFLLAALYAIAALAVWLWIYPSGRSPLAAFPAHLWHGHEMVFGFISAAIAGFLLTAVPSWTGRRGFAGAALIALVLLWLFGRAAFCGHAFLAPAVTAVLELAFLPALAVTIAPALLRTRNRNTMLLLVLLAFWVADAVFVHALLNHNAALATTALRVGLDVVLLLITVIGGRIVPAFTASALRRRGREVRMRSVGVVERLVVPAMVVLIVTDALPAAAPITASVAGFAGLLHLWRLSGWHGSRTASEPIVWVLHAAYLWLPLGLLLKAAHLGLGVGWAAHWTHALGAGAAATMILAVMTRASLGHTGRPLVVARPIVWAYALIIVAVLVRVFGPSLLPVSYPTTIGLAGAAWIAAFALFALVYAPVLLRPRVDGKPG